jgi:methylated-DNA-[protein]-cysteine S-methyltransferase
MWTRLEIDTPFPLLLATSVRGIRGLHFGLPGDTSSRPPHPELFQAASRQLAEYFAGRRTSFDLPLDITGTPFQLRVWAELQRIPYGETISYSELAKRIGSPKAVRAVGAASGRNPVPIIVPCHRVIASNGGLQGFGGGLEAKRLLLDLEGCGSCQKALFDLRSGRRRRPGRINAGVTSSMIFP